jgi:hypothetical protein
VPDRPPPRPTPHVGIARRRDYVGPENEDVTDLTEREIILRCYDATLHLKAGIRLELNMLEHRIKEIEHHLWPGTNQSPSGTTPEWDRRRHIDPLTEFSPEDTDHGSTKLPPGMFAALQQKVTRLEAEKVEADAYAAGQENVRREIERASNKRWERARKWLVVLVPLIALVFGGVGFLVKHLIDLPQTESRKLDK